MGQPLAKHNIGDNRYTSSAALLKDIGVRVVVFQFEHVLCPMGKAHIVETYDERHKNSHIRGILNRNRIAVDMIPALLSVGILPVIVTSYTETMNGHVRPEGGFVYQGIEMIKHWISQGPGRDYVDSVKVWEYEDGKFASVVRELEGAYKIDPVEILAVHYSPTDLGAIKRRGGLVRLVEDVDVGLV